MLLTRRGISRAQMEAAIVAGDTEIDAHITALAQAEIEDSLLSIIQNVRPVGGSSGTQTANNIYLARMRVSGSRATTNAIIFVTTASGNVDVCVYTSDGTTLTRVASTGSVAIAGTNTLQTIPLSVNWVFGVDYFVGVSIDNATASLFRVSMIGNGFTLVAAKGNQFINKASAFPAPTTILHSAMSGITVMPWVFFE